MNTRKYLITAISEAEVAFHEGNYPFGAVIVDSKGDIVAAGRNENFSLNDITAHAEIQCLRRISIKNLFDEKQEYHIFCSGEPCGGCSFFIAKTKSVKHIYWALTDPQKAGFDDLRRDRNLVPFFKHIGVTAEPSSDLKEKSAFLLREYYKKLGKPEKAKLY